MDAWTIRKTIDLTKPPILSREQPYLLMVPGDSNAHKWEITVLMHGQPANLTGLTASGIFMRYNNTIVTCSGDYADITGNVVTITFKADCYNVSGGMRGAVRLSGSAGTITLADQAFFVQRPFDAPVVEDDYIPSLPALLAEVSTLRQTNSIGMVLAAICGLMTARVEDHKLIIDKIPVTDEDAYDAAVAAGYTGTEEEWDAFVAALTDNTAMITEANDNAEAAWAASEGKAEVTSETVTALASGWQGSNAPYTQTISCTIATASNNLIVGMGGTLTDAQKRAFDQANIVCTGQGSGTITLSSYGIKPAVNLPINVLGVN